MDQSKTKNRWKKSWLESVASCRTENKKKNTPPLACRNRQHVSSNDESSFIRWVFSLRQTSFLLNAIHLIALTSGYWLFTLIGIIAERWPLKRRSTLQRIHGYGAFHHIALETRVSIISFCRSSDAKINLADQLSRLEEQVKGSEKLLQQPVLVDHFFSHTQMNDLLMLVRFFRFLVDAMKESRSSATKLVIRLVGSDLLRFAYAHLNPKQKVEKSDASLEKLVGLLTQILTFLLDIHPSCCDQVEQLGIFDRLESFAIKHSVGWRFCFVSNGNRSNEVLLDRSYAVASGRSSLSSERTTWGTF